MSDTIAPAYKHRIPQFRWMDHPENPPGILPGDVISWNARTGDIHISRQNEPMTSDRNDDAVIRDVRLSITFCDIVMLIAATQGLGTIRVATGGPMTFQFVIPE